MKPGRGPVGRHRPAPGRVKKVLAAVYAGQAIECSFPHGAAKEQNMPFTHTDHLFDAVQAHAFNRLPWPWRQTSNLYLDRRILNAGETLHQDVTLDRPTVLVFADDKPAAGFGHPCRYLLYNLDGDLYREVQAEFPPFPKSPETLRAFHQPILTLPHSSFFIPPELWCPRLFPEGERYAILFSGMSWMRNLNNHEFCYRMLIDRYGFKPANVYVLRYDGSLNSITGPAGSWPGDNTAYRIQVTGDGTRASLQSVLGKLKTKLRPQDLLFIHTENEAGNDGQAFFATYPNWGAYYAADFAADLSVLPPFQSLTVLLAQCYAGGFSQAVLTGSTAKNTSVASATSPFGNVAATPDGNFVKFGCDWIAAQLGHDPYGAALAFNPDADGDGVIEAEEAFDYAFINRSALDDPSFSESSEAGGDITLARRYVFWRWWCSLVLPVLKRYYVQPVGPEFHAKIGSLIPQLGDLVTPVIDRAARQVHAELLPEVTKIVESVFGSARI
jgi:hypothetical protein